MPARRWRLRVALAALAAALAGGLAWQRALPGRDDTFVTPAADAAEPRFPASFLWGVATAGTQIEVGQASDWAAFERDVLAHGRFAAGTALGTTVPGHIRDFGRWSAQVRAAKTGFDTRHAADLAQAAAMGINAFRISIEWARLFPRAGMAQPSSAGIAYYRQLLAQMRRNHITPLVTLFHYVSPEWFFAPDATGRRGWERADAMEHWQRYVTAVAENFVPDVTLWCTLNEPMVSLYNGYVEGSYPPLEQRADIAAAAEVYAGLLRAHAIAYRTLHAVAAARHADISVGIAQNINAFAPLRNGAPLDRLLARYVDQGWNWDFPDAIASGRLRIANTAIDREIPGLAGSQDFIGINYYMRVYVRGDVFHPDAPQILLHDPQAPAEPRNDLGWTVYPHGLYTTLARAAARYGKPVYILENGTADAADDDRGRQRYLAAHVREMWLALHQEKVDLRGYFHWSYIDNFEWTEGFDARFGLVAVDYEHDFKRTPRPSAGLYAAIIGAGGWTADLARRYPDAVP